MNEQRFSLPLLTVMAGLVLAGQALVMTAEMSVPRQDESPLERAPGAPHTADQDGDGHIELPELLRIIQFYTTGGFHCQAGTEDGYAPGAGGDTSCAVHASDYDTQDWSIELGELLRLIQFYNGGGCRPCVDTEDGFCVGANPPNVVFFVLDALRNDRVGARHNDVPITPFLEACAARGVRFTRASAPASWTRPSMAAIFSGMYPDVFQGDEDTPMEERFIVPPDVETIGEWFTGNGYDAWGIQTNANASATYGLDQGFPEGRYRFISFVPAAQVNAAVLENIDEWQEPFFVFAQYVDPHATYVPPPGYNEVFGPQPEITPYDEFVLAHESWGDFAQDLYLSWVNNTPPTWQPLSANGIEALRYRYDAETRYMDDELANVAAAIETRYPNTIFVLMADHGEALLERDIVGHGTSLYEEQARIPLILFGPGIAHQTIDAPVDALGLLPTLAKLLHFAPNPEWHGRDLLAPPPDQEPIFCYTRNRHLQGASVLMDGLKLIEHTRYPSPQLFNLQEDPGEVNDLSGALTADVIRLTNILETHQAGMTARYAESKAPLPDDVRQQLEALGYITADEAPPPPDSCPH